MQPGIVAPPIRPDLGGTALHRHLPRVASDLLLKQA
jgi:hypothetical protein